VNRGTLNGMLTKPLPLPKRLTRPETPPPFRLTERDIAIVRALARWRFLTSDQVVRYLSIHDPATSHQQVLRRLQGLYALGYLDRPRHQQLQLHAFAHLAYGLGRNGARLLAELGDAIDSRADWLTKNKRASAEFLMHTLETAEAMLAVKRGCHAADALTLVEQHELLPYFPDKTRALRDPFRCRISVRLPQAAAPLTIGVVPDRLFSLVHESTTRRNFALELDRGTMKVNAKTFGGTSFRRKILGYYHLWRERKHVDLWGFQSFRILTVTTSEKRIETMRAVQREVTDNAASGLFLYSTAELIAAHGALGDAWIDGAGDRVAIIG
jgi:hypothetical protein